MQPQQDVLTLRKIEHHPKVSIFDKNRAPALTIKMGKGTSWKEAEDVLLVRAWLDVSQDAKKGTDQTADTFWAAVHGVFVGCVKEKFKQNESERTIKAAKERFSEISTNCAKFTGCISTIWALNRSGKTENDNFDDAKALFVEQNKTKKAFIFESCWRILKESPKWASPTEKKKKQEESEHKDKDSQELKEIRPVGVKKAKINETEAKIAASQAKSIEIMAEAAKKNSLLLEKQVEIQEAKIGLDLFTLPTANLDEEAQEYIRLQKLIHLAKAQRDFSSIHASK